MSNIGDYQALVAALSVSFTAQDGTAIALTAKDATSLENSVQASGTPVRLLLPYGFGAGDNLAAQMGEPYIGNETDIIWTFSDVMLWRPNTFGLGMGDSTYDLREYLSAYCTAALSLDASSISDLMTLNGVNIVALPNLNYPEGADAFYIGAVATWTVTESDPL